MSQQLLNQKPIAKKRSLINGTFIKKILYPERPQLQRRSIS
ncbi:hypothetical protein VB620_15040 [Nodularia harveyana UHCC-0300]|uniref:Uncharacterized protein n=1 Tax=Nodularia harveyana UHCC-0300 TaxID=2974287 RepID=A0ABU5UHF0_9CYAN|nr:hypothetical protein [Nodularia harveyana]MEA5582654.1 hypothetical protein [Nodularia harveyana UHCC-0300]